MNKTMQFRVEYVFQFILLLFFLGLFLYLIESFLFVILFALAIVIATYPIYLKLLKKIKKPVLVSGLMILFFSLF